MDNRRIKRLYMYIMGIMMLFVSSCVVAQTPITNYQKVYYDYVIGGVVNEVGFVNDGYNSYHIITRIPVNTYWELCPVGHDIYIYNKTMTYKRLYKPNKSWIYYNKMKHHEHRKHVYNQHKPNKPNINHNKHNHKR